MESSEPTATSTDAGIATMPSVYTSGMPASEPQPTTTPSTSMVDSEFVAGVDGILKAIEILFSLVTFICATVWHPFVPLGGGWVQFVSMTALILTLFLYMLYLFRLTSKLSEQMPFKFVEFCYYCVFVLFYFIAGIVGAVNGYRNPAVIAATIFSFFSMAVYGVDMTLRFLAWRHSSEGPYFSSFASSLGGMMSTSSGDGAQY